MSEVMKFSKIFASSSDTPQFGVLLILVQNFLPLYPEKMFPSSYNFEQMS